MSTFITRLASRFATDESVSLLALGLRLSSGALLLPFILHKIPSAEMGVWYVFLSLGAIGPIFDMGFSSTLARFAAVFQAGANEVTAHGLPEAHVGCGPNLAGLSELYAVARRIYGITSILMSLALLIIGPLFVFDPHKPEMVAAATSLAWWLFVFASGSSVYAQFANTILRGTGRIVSSQLIQILSTVTYLIIVVTFIAIGRGIISLAVGMLVNNLVVGILSRRALFQTGVSPHAKVNGALFKKMVPNSWRMAAVSLGGYFIIHTNTLLCGRYTVLEETASYGLVNQLTTILEGIAGIFVAVKAPAFTRMSVQGDFSALRRTFFRALWIGTTFYAIGAILILFVAPTVLAVIGSKTMLMPFAMMAVFVGSRFLEFHHVQYAVLVMSENRVPFVWPAILSGAMIFMSGMIAVKLYGLWGLLIASTVVQLACNNWYPVVLGLRMLNRRNEIFEKSILNVS
jgi:O-antigen/teichoic acid export membrane protein